MNRITPAGSEESILVVRRPSRGRTGGRRGREDQGGHQERPAHGQSERDPPVGHQALRRGRRQAADGEDRQAAGGQARRHRTTHRSRQRRIAQEAELAARFDIGSLVACPLEVHAPGGRCRARGHRCRRQATRPGRLGRRVLGLDTPVAHEPGRRALREPAGLVDAERVGEPSLGGLLRGVTAGGHAASVDGHAIGSLPSAARLGTSDEPPMSATTVTHWAVNRSRRVPERRERSLWVLAFTFPGQGSQRSGMGHAWVDHPSWEVAGEASEIAGRDLTALLLDAPMEELTRTANAQLATFVMSLVVLDAVERLGLTPGACAGHSLGEYTALVASGALSLSDGTSLVIERGDAMQEAADARPGTMAALIGIADDDAEAACQRAESDVWVANYNAPGQVVIAGTEEGIALATGHAKELGARKVLPIPVSGAFHTPMMLPARTRLRERLDVRHLPRPRGPGRGQRRRTRPHRRRRMAGAPVGAALQSRPLAALARGAERQGRDLDHRTRTGRRLDRNGA